ncbi:transketolase [Streptomyces sp. NPDC051001]|uniref:transketolase n=1 Tax=Streptomyces sp. NPDC051001 TaxID=3155795 RepID=UPI0034452C4E
MHSDMLIAAAESLPDATMSGTVLVGYGAVEELTRFAATPGWTVHVPGHPAEVRRAVLAAVAGGERAYIHVCADSNTEPRGATEGFELVREGLDGVVLAVGSTLDPVLRATAGLDLTVLYATTVRPFDEIGLRTAALAADRADLVLVEPGLPGTSARQVAGTLVHVPHRLLALGGADVRDEEALGRAVRGFLR